MSPPENSKSAAGNSDRIASCSDQTKQPTSLHTASQLMDEDPLYRHALYEAKIILGIWLLAMLVTCTYCYLYGYASHPSQPTAWGGGTIDQWVGPLKSFDRDPASLTTPWGLGIPKWVLVGIVIPWTFCILATIWFCLFVFHNDDLGEIAEEEEIESTDETPIKGEALHG